MKKIKIVSLALASVVLLGSMFSIPAFAGKEINSVEIVDSETGLNSSDWYFIGEIGFDEKSKIMTIPADTSSEETRFISKIVSQKADEIPNMSTVDATLKLSALPKGEQVIFAFGLSSIEGMSGETGNVEISISNDGGLKIGVVTYEEDKTTTILAPKSAGITLNREFQFSATITNKQVLTVKINGNTVCQKNLPVSGEGRFGVLQTGGCGMQFSKLNLTNQSYVRPENTNIDENFENGDFNANELCSAMITAGLAPASHAVKEYNGNQVYMMKNAARSYIGTKHLYSNFEISFDIPYWPSKDILDEEGNRIQLSGDSICIGWGETVEAPINNVTYNEDIDLIQLNKTSAKSYLKKTFTVNYDVEGMPTANDDVGYSVKFSFIDGCAELQVKPLTAKNYTTVQTIDYSDVRSGYVKLWTINGGTLAIDNLKITNKDSNPNVIDVERKSSISVFEDYDITQESTELLFREEVEEEEEAPAFYVDSKASTFLIVAGVQTVILVIVGIVIYNVMKRKKKGGDISENA